MDKIKLIRQVLNIPSHEELSSITFELPDLLKVMDACIPRAQRDGSIKLTTPITATKLPNKAKVLLPSSSAEIFTVENLLNTPNDYFIKINGLGEKTMAEIKKFKSQYKYLKDEERL